MKDLKGKVFTGFSGLRFGTIRSFYLHTLWCRNMSKQRKGLSCNYILILLRNKDLFTLRIILLFNKTCRGWIIRVMSKILFPNSFLTSPELSWSLYFSSSFFLYQGAIPETVESQLLESSKINVKFSFCSLIPWYNSV